MYEGDKKRDATSKIRGFIFQDYITIMCLLRDKVEYVCSEYLEDVDVFYKNGKFEFIQVKYYPNTSPQREEIFTDLYYQYLRLKMLGSTLDAIPSLYIHRVPEINKPTLQEMKDYLKIKIPKKIDYSTVEDSKKWLRSNIYTISKKKEQKAKFFKTMASEDSLKDFINQFKISSQKTYYFISFSSISRLFTNLCTGFICYLTLPKCEKHFKKAFIFNYKFLSNNT